MPSSLINLLVNCRFKKNLNNFYQKTEAFQESESYIKLNKIFGKNPNFIEDFGKKLNKKFK